MKIRQANLTDLEAITAIYNSAIPGRMATADLVPVTLESRKKWFAEHSPARPIWVAEDDGVVMGWLSLQAIYNRPAYHATAEVSLYISEAYRRRGVGRQLLEYAVNQCPRLQIRNLLALIFGHNQASIALVEQVGFQRWGLLPGVTELDGVERDVVIYGLKLPHAAERERA